MADDVYNEAGNPGSGRSSDSFDWNALLGGAASDVTSWAAQKFLPATNTPAAPQPVAQESAGAWLSRNWMTVAAVVGGLFALLIGINLVTRK